MGIAVVDTIKRINKVTQIPGLVPLASLLAEGQIAINAADGKLYIRLLAGNVICVGQDVANYADAIESAIDGIDIESYALATDVATALANVAQQFQSLANAITGKASSTHGHAITEVTGLQSALDEKQPAGNYAPSTHSHAIAQVDNLQATIDALVAQIQGKQPAGNYAPSAHGHGIAEIAQLGSTLLAMQLAIDGKQAAGSYAPLVGVSGNWTCSALIGNSYIAAGQGYSIRIGNDTVAKNPNRNGWQLPTGPKSTATFNSNTVSLIELAKRVSAVIEELRYHGLLSQYGQVIL